jgi:hypothetical protein
MFNSEIPRPNPNRNFFPSEKFLFEAAQLTGSGKSRSAMRQQVGKGQRLLKKVAVLKRHHFRACPERSRRVP